MSSFEDMIKQNPESFFRSMAKIKAAEQAMFKVARQWAQKNGAYTSQDGSVSYTKRTRTNTYISVKQAINSIRSQGLVPEELAELTFTEDGLSLKLGEEKALQVFKQMAKDGCFKKYKTQYWRLQIK